MSKIALILAQDFADWEFGLISGTGGPFYGLDVQFFSPTPGTLRSQGGLNAEVQQGLADLDDWTPDVVAVIGGLVWETPEAPGIGSTLVVHHKRGAAIAGICGGTLALARAGLLDKVAHTSNDAEFLTAHAKDYAGAGRFQDCPKAVTEGGIITAPGTAPASFTAAIFAAAGLDAPAVEQFTAMMAAEHQQ